MKLDSNWILALVVIVAFRGATFATPGSERGSPEAPTSAASTMLAARITAYGGPEVLSIERIAKPAPGKGEVLVRVHAAGVNPIDWKVRDGALKGRIADPPMTAGYDVSGVVESVGEGVVEFSPNDEVYAFISLKRGGAYAEFATIPKEQVARKPAKIDHVHAAAVPLAALTAMQALYDHAGLKTGQTVLIHAAAGGVGHFAVQLAKARGATVIATAGGANEEFLRGLGVDRFINYKAEKFDEVVRGVDVVLESLGGENLERSYKVLKPGGVLISIMDDPSPEKLKEYGIRGEFVSVRPSGAQLGELGAMIDEGKIVPHVSEVLPLDQAAKALERSAAGRTRGKIVLKVR